ncbi:hypothetical protein FAF44_36530 [Nonomuraea sp. MG754425]|uniref:sensor histidine kinase n=1 Tax=Nonomuraea sp. MG754425 TaxID=2570319 RepID=UPI001F0007FD|nr:histidine kinase [Nonomuraea sp. MG754425]MCF6473853.1 hypothetical protein [Nonomuraea sp. MG754425]
MASDDTRSTGRGRPRRPLATLSRLSRLGDVPVVIMLAWAGWLAVPWSFSGLAQARAAAAAAAAEAETPQPRLSATGQEQPRPPADQARFRSAGAGHAPVTEQADQARFPATGAGPMPVSAQADQARFRSAGAGQGEIPGALPEGRCAAATWGIPAARAVPFTTLRPSPGDGTAPAAGPPPVCAPDASGGAPAAFVPDPARGATGADEAVARERARIAGEVHDAAGHGLSAIALQAGLALVTLDDDPEQARASLRAIRETSTTALAHLRAALDGIDPPAGDLAGLIDGVRAAGLPVDVEPPVFAVPAPLRAPVYRVVRESLTNVLRHAGPTRALVRASGSPHGFVVEVADRGVGRTGSGEGRGLAGMRAGVREAGGHLTAGPREGGGFRVVASFPQVQA